MVKTLEVFDSDISIEDSDFNISKIYNETKNKADKLGYDFLEKGQSLKPKKYGDEIKVNFIFVKEVDDFCDAEIKTDFKFSSMSRGKEGDRGNGSVSVKASITLDKENNWGKNIFNKFLFEIYTKIKEKEYEKKYIVPIASDAQEIYNTIKDSFES